VIIGLQRVLNLKPASPTVAGGFLRQPFEAMGKGRVIRMRYRDRPPQPTAIRGHCMKKDASR